mmetsp:Transcript_76534/g.150003  ORF Transcript_76534/g.150003 Transcript_76534/m.150003 type:complete len:216 (+) Transcript_76534:639-1286(+)
MEYRELMGLPKASRSRAYFVAQSNAACAMPRACAAIPMRPASRVFIAILNPSPLLPISASAGSTTFSKMRLAVEVPLMPSLSSLAPKLNPTVSVGTMNALMALDPFCFRSVVANTTAQSASCALVIHALVPLSVHSFDTSSCVAVVTAAPASEPLPGSLNPKHPSFEPLAKGVKNSSFCAGDAARSTGPQYRLLLTETMQPVEAHPRLISSTAMA